MRDGPLSVMRMCKIGDELYEAGRRIPCTIFVLNIVSVFSLQTNKKDEKQGGKRERMKKDTRTNNETKTKIVVVVQSYKFSYDKGYVKLSEVKER